MFRFLVADQSYANCVSAVARSNTEAGLGALAGKVSWPRSVRAWPHWHWGRRVSVRW